MKIYTEQEVEAMMSGQKAVGEKFTTSPANGIAPYSHGTGGLFSTPGQDPRIFSAMSLPINGLLDALPVMPAGTAAVGLDSAFGGYDTPLYSTVTGVTSGDLDAIANQPTEACADPPIPGLLKLCIKTAQYGRFYGRVRAMDLQRVARLSHRGEPTDLQIVNQAPITGDINTSTLMPGLAGGTTSELNTRLYEAAVSWKRMLAPQTYTGDPVNTVASNGYKQFTGMDLLINTGNHRDALTGAVCTALNSFIMDFGDQLVNNTGGNDMVEFLDSMVYNLQWNATQHGLDPASWILVMRPELFDELTKIWPVRYYQEALNEIASFQANGGRVFLDGRETTNFRDEMRRGLFLPIRGQRFQVVLDNTIAETQPTAGVFESEIYFVPMTVLGSIPVTYLEAFNYNARNVREVIDFGGLNNSRFTTSDGGHFLWWSSYTNTCIDFRWLLEYRVILRTPQIAGRVQNVRYQPLVKSRSWDPNDTSFFFDGGVNSYAGGSYYNDWSENPYVIGA